ncbi:uncharacterized protein isoform X4 [Rhodnius prolixus]|uniref:uncharacterized protein isoform X4 n=1 Tax=Rhodnius prolixus TaxID=13249 RepID=UPI003D18DA90
MYILIHVPYNLHGAGFMDVIETGGVIVKQERPDDAEINDLAAKILEQNKAKLAALATSGNNTASGPSRSTNVPNIFTRAGSKTPSSTPTPPASSASAEAEKPPLDSTSQKGKFGWVRLGDEYIPYIQRSEEKYCAVRMVELKVLAKYLNYLNSDIYSCTCIRSYYITESEARLLTEINIKHCEGKFGRDPFTVKDLVVLLDDANEFHNFLELCYTKLINPLSSTKDRCGFVRINNESVVPYTTKDGDKYVPLFYFEGETEALKKKSAVLGPWDLAYLKFCCKVQGIRSELFANDSCQVISLADIRAYFPQGTIFDEYWPPKIVDSQLLVQKNNSSGQGNMRSGAGLAGGIASWIKAPPGPVGSTAAVTQDPSRLLSGASVATNGWPHQNVSSQQRYHASSHPSRVQQPSVHNTNAAVTSVSNNLPRTYSRQPNIMTSQQYYQSHMPQANSQVPPPLVRSTPSNPSLGYHSYPKDDWSPTYTTPSLLSHSGMSMINNSAAMMHHPHMQQYPTSQQPPQSNNNNNSSVSSSQKYPPPPLIPVNGSTSRYYNNSSSEVIDLSSPPHSPQRSLILNGAKQQSSQQPSRHSMQQQQQSSGQQPTKVNGLILSKLIPIAEVTTQQSSNHIPFRMQKALVQGKMVPCINAKPYMYSELLMTVSDLMEHFFPQVSIAKCNEVLQNVLQVNLYSGNLQQKTVLRENNKCKTLTETLPLIQLKDVMQYMPQLRYVMERHAQGNNGESAPKRQRIS